MFFATHSLISNDLIHDLKISRDLFSNDFILNSAREATIVHDEIASEHGFPNTESLFLMHLNNKEAAAEVLQAAEAVREHFGASNVLLLLENEKEI